MAIQLDPKLEQIVRSDAVTAGYASVYAYLEDVLIEQHAQELWFAENRESIQNKIEAAFASEGKGMDRTPDEAALELHSRLRRHFAERNID